MVNTFLPYADFHKCAKVLDNKRLGKQRVEASQILRIALGKNKSKAWTNHPAVLMWHNYSKALMMYYNIIVEEWIRRGFVNNMKFYDIVHPIEMPWFIGNKSFHLSHQASLLRKNFKHYSDYFKVPAIYIEYSYIWPSKLDADQKELMFANPNKVLNPSLLTIKYTKK